MPGCWDVAEHSAEQAWRNSGAAEIFVELSPEVLHCFELFSFSSFNKILPNKPLISILSAWFWGRVVQEICAELSAFTWAGCQWWMSGTALEICFLG